MKKAIRFGIYYSLFSILVSLTTYLVNRTWLFHSTTSLIYFILHLSFLIIGGRILLRPQQGNLTYGEALKYLFTAILTGLSITIIYTWIAYGGNEELEKLFLEFAQRSGEKGIEVTTRILGGSDVDIEDAIAEYRKGVARGEISLGTYPFKPSSLPFTFLMGTFAGLIYALISAIFVRKK